MKRLTQISLGVGILVMGCATAGMRLHDLNADAKRKEAILKRYPELSEAKTGMVFRVKQDLLLLRDSAPERYYTARGSSTDPLSKEEYYASPHKWPLIVGIVEKGTTIRGVKFEQYEPSALAVSEFHWVGIVYEIIDGPNAGKLIVPMPPLFSKFQRTIGCPNPEFLETVSIIGVHSVNCKP